MYSLLVQEFVPPFDALGHHLVLAASGFLFLIFLVVLHLITLRPDDVAVGAVFRFFPARLVEMDVYRAERFTAVWAVFEIVPIQFYTFVVGHFIHLRSCPSLS